MIASCFLDWFLTQEESGCLREKSGLVKIFARYDLSLPRNWSFVNVLRIRKKMLE